MAAVKKNGGSKMRKCIACWPFPRNNDPDLFDMYANKLIIQGWAGQKTIVEKEYYWCRSIEQIKSFLAPYLMDSSFDFSKIDKILFDRDEKRRSK